MASTATARRRSARKSSTRANQSGLAALRAGYSQAAVEWDSDSDSDASDDEDFTELMQ